MIGLFEPVTDDMLAKSAEFDGETDLRPQDDGTVQSPAFVFEAELDESSALEDGTPLPRMIYTLKVAGVPEQAQAEDDGLIAQGGENIDAGLAAQEVPGQVQAEDGALLGQAEEGVVTDLAMQEVSEQTQVGDGVLLAQTDEGVDGGLVATEAGNEELAPQENPSDLQSNESVEGQCPFATPIPGTWTPIPREDDGLLESMQTPRRVSRALETTVGSTSTVRPNLQRMSMAIHAFRL